jgi:hypothetical protein
MGTNALDVQKKNSVPKSISLTKEEWAELDDLRAFLGVSRTEAIRILLSYSKIVITQQFLGRPAKK